MKIEERFIKFGDIEIEKQNYHEHKIPIPIKNIDINKIAVSSEVSFGKRVLIISLATNMLKK